jgi:uncharacterized protein (TIGR02058 family)
MSDRLILEMGMGNDLYGMDYTKAACRAVQDALHHSSLTLFKSLNLNTNDMTVKVTIGVQEPEKVDVQAVITSLPRGIATAEIVFGGQNITDKENDTTHIIAVAGIEAMYPICKEEWRSIED